MSEHRKKVKEKIREWERNEVLRVVMGGREENGRKMEQWEGNGERVH